MSQLPLICLDQIDMGSIPEIRPFRKVTLELDGHVGADLETTLSDGGTDRDPKIFWSASKPIPHGLNRLWGNFGNRTSPAGMNSSDGPRPRVGDEDGKAICGSYAQHEPWLICDQRVPFAGPTWMPSFENVVGMNLPDGGNGGWIRPPLGPPDSKAVLNPRDFFQQRRQVEVPAIEVQQAPL